MTSIGLHLSLLLLLAVPAEEVVVQPGEALAEVARRTLGDERGAEELRALNALSGDEVAAGTRLKLPGPDRAQAISALQAARNAVGQASTPTKREEALAQLGKAERLLARARYAEAAQAADKAWELLTGSPRPSTRFTLEVERSGRTQVTAHSGHPVRVEAEGVTRSVYPGQVASVEKGAPPGQPEAPPEAPALLAPLDGAKLKARGGTKGTQVTLSWRPVEGTRVYEVELVPEGSPNAEPITLTVSRTEAKPSLADGSYRWAVRALGESTRSAASASRTFQLIPAPEELRLEVKGTKWQ